MYNKNLKTLISSKPNQIGFVPLGSGTYQHLSRWTMRNEYQTPETYITTEDGITTNLFFNFSQIYTYLLKPTTAYEVSVPSDYSKRNSIWEKKENLAYWSILERGTKPAVTLMPFYISSMNTYDRLIIYRIRSVVLELYRHRATQHSQFLVRVAASHWMRNK